MLNLASNLTTCLGFFACQACTDCLKSTLKQQVRLSYILFDGVFVFLAIAITYWLSGALSSTGWMSTLLRDFIHCPADSDLSCLGVSSVYRISFALVIFHIVILFFVFMRNGCSKVFNEEVWPFKVLFVVVACIGLFFLSNSFFQVYSKIAMVLSLFFLIFQIIMIIDLFYLWGANWINKYDEGQSCYMYLLIIATVLLYGGTIYWTVMSYKWFGGCGIGTFANTTNVVFIVLNAALIFLGINPSGSLLTSAAVSCYSTYLIWSGLSNMNETCNSLLTEEFTTIFHLVFGLVFIITSLVYVSVGDSDSSTGQVMVAKGALADKEPLQNDPDLEERMITRLRNYELKAYEGNSFIYFHLIMLVACCYVAMLLTNWGSPVISGQAFFQFQASTLSMWIKIVAAWITMALYTWTLIAPRIFPDRDFS